MTCRTIEIGERRADLLSDGIFETTRDVLIHRHGDAARSRMLEAWGDRPFRVDVNVVLLRGPGGTELVDAGTGTAWGEGLGHARAALRDLGLGPASIDRVFLTHIHGDHALGLLDGAAPYLPRARILVPAADLAYFGDADRGRLQPAARRGGFDIAAKLLAAYGERIEPIPFGAVAPGIDLLPLPGHTPGQGGYLFTAGDEGLLLLGDALHLSDLQGRDPDAGTVFDVDPDAAADTRRAILARAAERGWIVGGGHLPGFSRVEVAGTGFRFSPV